MTRPIVGRLHHGACGSCDGNKIGIVRIGGTFYAISNGEKRVKSLNKIRMSVKKAGYTFDDARGIDSAGEDDISSEMHSFQYRIRWVENRHKGSKSRGCRYSGTMRPSKPGFDRPFPTLACVSYTDIE
jgi:hypothetical protein